MSLPAFRPGQGLIVKREYQSEFLDPIQVKKGETLIIGDKKTVYPEWLWVTIPDGRSGWMPEEFVSRSLDRVSAKCDYDATELTVNPGDRLTLLETVAAWVRVETADGCIGWVPEENVSPED